MEQTLGKRIVSNRKRMGLTQDQLAEKLGVTAQAVSKWENDQSCPDITTLPKLAEIFGITTDQLLGIEHQQVHTAEVVTGEEQEPEGFHFDNGKWEIKYDAGRKGSVGIAVWVVLVGGLMLASNLLGWETGLWDVAWPAALLIFGLWGLYPKFSFFRLGCSLFGAYFLLDNLNALPFALGKDLLLPICILLFGLSLLVDALKKDKKPHVHVTHDGVPVHDSNSGKFSSTCTTNGEIFHCSTSFGEDTHFIQLPRLSRGEVSVSFGELTVDLSGCEEIAENCRVSASCSFGELNLLVPRRWRVEPASKTAFASVDVEGSPSQDAAGIIYLDCSASFGEIQVKYI